MKYPWANVLLLSLGLLELATGFLGLMGGTPERAVLLHVHRAGGFAIVALLVWKGQNILPSFQRPARWKRFFVPYSAFAVAVGFLLLVLALGIAWSHVGPFYFMGFSGVSWHIYLSVTIVPLVVWHVAFHRRSLKLRFWAERRSFLRFTGLGVVGLFLWRSGEFASVLLSLPGASRRFTGSYRGGDFSGNAFPVTSWLNDRPSPIRAKEWRLTVEGSVDNQLAVSYDQVSKYHHEVTATLDCTGGWYSTQEWKGVLVKEVLAQAGLKSDAASVTVRSVTGYYRRFSLEEIDGYILATRVGGEALSHSHGFPLRLVAPDKRGYEWVKWVTAIEVNDTGAWLQPPLPLQ